MTSVGGGRAGGLKKRKQGVDPITIFDVPRLSLSLGTQRVLWLFSGMRCVHLFIFVDLPYRDPFHDPRTCTVDIAGRSKNGTTAAAQPCSVPVRRSMNLSNFHPPLIHNSSGS